MRDLRIAVAFLAVSIALTSDAALAQSDQRGVGAAIVNGAGLRGTRPTGAPQTPIGAPQSRRTPLIGLAVDNQGRAAQPFLFFVTSDSITPPIYFQPRDLVPSPATTLFDLRFCRNDSHRQDANECFKDRHAVTDANNEITRRSTTPTWDQLHVQNPTQQNLSNQVSQATAYCYFLLWRASADTSKQYVSIPFSLHSGSGRDVCR